MGGRIEKLTPEQQRSLALFRAHGLAVGLSTTACDRSAAEAAVSAHYRALGRAAPRIVVWLDSPFQGVIGATLLSGAPITGASVRAQVGARVGDQVRDQVGAQVWDQVRDQVGDQVRDQVRAQVWDQVGDQVRDQVGAQVWAQVGDQVRDQVGAQVWAQVGDQVRDQVGAQVWAQVGDQVRDQVGDQVGAQVWAQVGDQVRDQVRDQIWRKAAYGGHDMDWGAWASAMRSIGVKLPAAGETLITVCETCGWWWPFENAVIITDRPSVLCRDGSGRLHSTTGPAIRYPDGWAIHAVNGVRVPEWVVERQGEITPESIRKEANAEIRRVMIRLYGLDRYMSDVGAIVVDQAAADDPRKGLRTGRLCRVEDESGRWHFIDVLNSTPEPDGTIKRYQMVVNGDCYGGEASSSLLAAWASTYRDPRDHSKLAFAKPEHALFAAET